MIKPGTLCYIVRSQYPERVGRVVTVIGPPGYPMTFDRFGVPHSSVGYVTVAAGWLPKPKRGKEWMAKIVDLRPIHGPDAEQSIRETDTVRDHDEITRRMA